MRDSERFSAHPRESDMTVRRLSHERSRRRTRTMNIQSRARIRVARRYRASPERVFDAWLDPSTAGSWLFATALRPMARVKIDGRVGGSFYFAEQGDGEDIEHSGEYIDVARPRRLAFTLSANGRTPHITRVISEILPWKRGCELILTHENLPADHARSMKTRWIGILYGLGEMLDQHAGRARLSTLVSTRSCVESG